MNLIQELKDNKRPFGLMSDDPQKLAEMQATAKSIGRQEFQWYSDDGFEFGSSPIFYQGNTYRLRPDYGDVPEIEECGIRVDSCGDLTYKRIGGIYDIDTAFRNPDCIGFKFSDGIIRGASVAYTRPAQEGFHSTVSRGALLAGTSEVVRATHVLFRRSLK